jgi:hypothetical protein
MATGTVCKQIQWLLLDAVFHFTACAIELIIEKLRFAYQIGNHITGMTAFVSLFDFNHDAPCPFPAFSSIVKFVKPAYLFI